MARDVLLGGCMSGALDRKTEETCRFTHREKRETLALGQQTAAKTAASRLVSPKTPEKTIKFQLG
jgi:hypothetical protein